jgi:hypothetical protein
MVLPTELLARYIYVPWHIIENTRVHPATFLPPPVDGKTSVYRINGLPGSAILAIGNRIGANRNPPVPLLGRAELTAKTVFDQKLEIEPAAPPPLHANISGWPPNKAAKMVIALQLTKNSTLRI